MLGWLVAAQADDKAQAIATKINPRVKTEGHGALQIQFVFINFFRWPNLDLISVTPGLG